ncbi:MAG: hypothetical protein ACT4O2_00980 [Beijerinckiaceae bacterium]
MDEPFAALDPVSRAALQDEISGIHARSGKTIVFVTHDMDEALRLATGMAVMNNGRLIQTGTPASILLAPADDFVRDFLGGESLQLRLLDLVPVRKPYEAREITRGFDHRPGGQPEKRAEPNVGAPLCVSWRRGRERDETRRNPLERHCR